MPYTYQTILNMRVELKKCRAKLLDPGLLKSEELWYKERIFVLEGKMGQEVESSYGKTTRELKKEFSQQQLEAKKHADESLKQMEEIITKELDERAPSDDLLSIGKELNQLPQDPVPPPNGSENSESENL